MFQIEKFGDPNGIVQFSESVLGEQVFNESRDDEGPFNITLPVIRRQGVVGDITVRPGTFPLISSVVMALYLPPPQVLWQMESDSDMTGDFLSVSGSVRLRHGQREAEIVLRLLPDAVPELEELYTILLTAVEGGATLARDQTLITTHIRSAVIRQDWPALSKSTG